MERNTTNLSISLPKGMKDRIKRRVKDDHFGTPSDYLRSLVREDLRHRDEERLEHALLEGLQSGRGTDITAKADWKKFWSNIDAHRDTRRTRKYA
jgi:antitoxin ParD1/3/4